MRYLNKKTALISLMAGTALCLPASAMAQTATQTLLEEVVITGTKKKNAENVQDVAAAVTAFGDAQLEALKIKDLQSLSYSIPNVSFDDVGTFKSTANFSIRGLGINSSIPSIDPTVGVFVDGVYLGITQGVVFDIFDLESIEVLRGPQGILFGRNVTGGAVLINTKKPSDELTIDAKSSIETGFRGTNPAYTFAGSVSGPIVDGVLNAKIAAYYNKDEGWFRNTLADGTTENFGEAETILIRPALHFFPSENLDILLRYEHGEFEGDGPAGQNHTNGLGQSNPFFSPSRQSFQFSIDEPGFADSEWDQVFVEANLDVSFGDGTITNVFGWRDFESSNLSDIDATPLFLFHAGSTLKQDQFSNEIRYNGRFFDKLDVTTGLYYFNQDIIYDEDRFLLGGAALQNGGGVQDQRTLGAFLNFDFDITDSITFTAGGRYTHERKSVVLSTLPLNGTPCDVQVDCSRDFQSRESWENFSPKVGVQWAATDDINLYGHWARGFRSGGYNFRNTVILQNLLPDDFDLVSPGPFDQERIDSFEVGFKAKPGSKATLNAALYYNKIDNLQREVNIPDDSSVVRQIIRNTANATIWGFEVEGQYAVSDNLLLRASVGHANGEYDRVLFDLNGDGAINQADLDLDIPRLAPWTFGGGFVFSEELGDLGIFDLRLDYFHRDSSPFTDNNLGVLNNFDSLTTNATLTTLEGRLAFSIYGKNLLNEVQFGGDTQLPPAVGPVPLGGTFSPLNKGRVIGFEVKFKY